MNSIKRIGTRKFRNLLNEKLSKLEDSLKRDLYIISIGVCSDGNYTVRIGYEEDLIKCCHDEIIIKIPQFEQGGGNV